MSIKVFKRAVWKRDPVNRRWVPYTSALKRHVCYVENIEQARAVCKEHNDNRRSKGETFYEFTEN